MLSISMYRYNRREPRHESTFHELRFGFSGRKERGSLGSDRAVTGYAPESPYRKP
jgi:hypothetical protein